MAYNSLLEYLLPFLQSCPSSMYAYYHLPHNSVYLEMSILKSHEVSLPLNNCHHHCKYATINASSTCSFLCPSHSQGTSSYHEPTCLCSPTHLSIQLHSVFVIGHSNSRWLNISAGALQKTHVARQSIPNFCNLTTLGNLWFRASHKQKISFEFSSHLEKKNSTMFTYIYTTYFTLIITT